VAKKQGKKSKVGGKGRAKSDRALLELGDELLTAVHLHRAVQEDEVRAALAVAHPDLVQAVGDLVTRIAERFLERSGVEVRDRSGYAAWAENGPAAQEEQGDNAGRPALVDTH